VQGVGTRVNLSAFDALDGTRADFTQFSQALLRQSFLLAQFSDFESEIRLVHVGFSFSVLMQLSGVMPCITTACGRHLCDICLSSTTFCLA
jgi:hypothetical protein